MLIQTVGSKQLVYVGDYKLGYMEVAAEFGMLENGTLASYVRKTDEPYVNQFGVHVPSVHLNGRTVDIHVVNDSIRANGVKGADIAAALNYFPNDSQMTLGGFTFVSKFSANNGPSDFSVRDSVNRVFSTRVNNRKDLRGIYNMMVHLSDNNGKLYEPVIARYVYTSYQMPRHRQLVGYFDLGEYLAVIQDRRYGELFKSMSRSNALVIVECKENVNPLIKVTNVVNNCAKLEMLDIAGTYDAKKLNEFKPIVVLTRRPLTIKTMKFPWSRVKFDGVDVFMTPLMSLTDAWETLEGGINLLSLPTGNAKNLRF